jgi:hypothetical protein
MRYYCKNCGSIFTPSLAAEFQSISVRCSFCHHESPLVPIPDFETPERYRERTGKKWGDGNAVYIRRKGCSSLWIVKQYQDAKSIRVLIPITIICATEAGRPPKDWSPE